MSHRRLPGSCWSCDRNDVNTVVSMRKWTSLRGMVWSVRCGNEPAFTMLRWYVQTLLSTPSTTQTLEIVLYSPVFFILRERVPVLVLLSRSAELTWGNTYHDNPGSVIYKPCVTAHIVVFNNACISIKKSKKVGEYVWALMNCSWWCWWHEYLRR